MKIRLTERTNKMKYIIFTIISFACMVLSAQTVEYSESAEMFLNNLELNQNTPVNSGFTDASSVPDSFTNSWFETPDYIYVKSEKNTLAAQILSSIESSFGEEYITKYDETAGKVTKKLKKFSRGNIQNYPVESRKAEIEQEFIIKAKEFVNKIPEIGNDVMFDGIAVETTDSLTENSVPRITEIRVYYRRILDGAVFNDSNIPVKIVYDTASSKMKTLEINWIDYESVPNLNYFEKYEAGFESENIRYSFENGRTAVGVYGSEVFDSIYVYSVEKVWRKKTCEGEELFIPAMKFYIKVYSEKGIQSIPEYLEAGIKEAVFKPVYELMENNSCR